MPTDNEYELVDTALLPKRTVVSISNYARFSLAYKLSCGLIAFVWLAGGLASDKPSTEPKSAFQTNGFPISIEAGPGLVVKTQIVNNVTVLRIELVPPPRPGQFTILEGPNITFTHGTNFWLFNIIRQIYFEGTNYTVSYDVNTNSGSYIPLTNPPGPPHWNARVQVFQSGRKIGEIMDGSYTPNMCIADDWPSNYVRRALGLPQQWK